MQEQEVENLLVKSNLYNLYSHLITITDHNCYKTTSILYSVSSKQGIWFYQTFMFIRAFYQQSFVFLYLYSSCKRQDIYLGIQIGALWNAWDTCIFCFSIEVSEFDFLNFLLI